MPVSVEPELELLDAATAYERWAPTYDATANALLALEQRTLERRLPALANRVVLDLACGTGRWMRYARQRGAYAIGVDLSPAMLAQAKSKSDIGNSLVCGDAAALPFASASAHLVICSFAISYVRDLDRFAAGVSRVCKPGATVLISDVHPAAAARGWRRTFRDGSRTYEIATWTHLVDDVVLALRRAGLRLDSVSEAALGEPERAIFDECGKPDLFERVAGEAAVVIYSCAKPLSPRLERPTATAVLENARVALGPHTSAKLDVVMRGGKIAALETPARSRADARRIDCTGLLLLPGLINAHDHLEFSLFPRLGRGPYRNFQEWSADIYRPNDSPVREHRAVAKETRLWCGGLKNLLCGASTVSHHNEFAGGVFTSGFPVRVLRRCGWAHSFALGDVEAAFRQTPRSWPVIVHLGEGTDDDSRAELQRLRDIGALGSRTVIVHGVAFAGEEAAISAAGAALVWCPSSNRFTLGATWSAEALRRISRVALGTDSAISGAGDLFDEIRFAHAECGASPGLLYEMVTRGAAGVLQLGRRLGRIGWGCAADVVALEDRGRTPCETLAAASFRDVEMVMVGGMVRLLSPASRERWPRPCRFDLRPIAIEGCARLVPRRAAEAIDAARVQLGEVRIAGKRVTS